ncbi:MAG: (d)CMP kinase [Chloroflexi bacterium]|nr:(d)CMP kinase [Chloroflexota bacterium]
MEPGSHQARGAQLSTGVAPFIAIDGPVGSGKTAVGRVLADRLGHMFLDTGVMYRAVTYLALQKQIALSDPDALVRLASSSGMELTGGPGEECRVIVRSGDVTDHLRSPEGDRSVSAVSAVSGVREVLVGLQREIAAKGQIVMVGRDIGTVVMSGAGLKIYLDASVEERARRRHAQLQESGTDIAYDTVLEDLRRRDDLDSSREVAPLKRAADAVDLTTDDLGIDEVVDRLEELARGPGFSGTGA